MKKIIFALLFTLAIVQVNAQSTVPRLNKKTVKITLAADAALSDTVKITPSEYETLINVSLTDTLTIKVKSNSQASYGDIMKLFITNSSGSNHYVRLPYAQFKTTSADSTIGLTSAKKALMVLWFDGTVWQEQSLSKNQ